MDLQRFKSEEEFYAGALAEVLKCIHEAIENHGQARVGLAGGTTPAPLYRLLSQQPLDFSKILFIQTDERQVPSFYKESNLGMIRQNLLLPAKLSRSDMLSFDTSLPEEEAAKKMHDALQKLMEIREPLFDCLILGAGADGHIASIFPNDPTLNENQLASPARAKGYTTERRLTVTMKALKNSKNIFLLLKNKPKPEPASPLWQMIDKNNFKDKLQIIVM